MFVRKTIDKFRHRCTYIYQQSLSLRWLSSSQLMNVMVAVGGNAIKQPQQTGTLTEMFDNVRCACEQLATLICHGHCLLVTHGNGPQVGNIYLQNQLCVEKDVPPMDLAACVAESEGLIGYLLQHELENALRVRRVAPRVATVISQMVVDAEDPAWSSPSKPIGMFYTENEAKKLRSQGQSVMEDSGRGWRVCVPSPRPIKVVEIDAIRTLVTNGFSVIAGGGGGIPVIQHPSDQTYISRDAVIDKDFAAVIMAKSAFDCDLLMLLTDVDGVYTGYGTPTQTRIEEMTIDDAHKFISENQFGKGSMLPKVQACVDFVRDTGKCAVITSLSNAVNALDNTTRCGTWITP